MAYRRFSYGVHPEHLETYPESWDAFARSWLRDHDIEGNVVMLTEGPTVADPRANDRMELIDLGRDGDDLSHAY